MKIWDIKDNECWWGGGIRFGTKMPFTKDTEIKVDLRGVETNDCANQTMPFLVSNKGRYIWCDEDFVFEFKDGKIYADGKNIDIYEVGETLKDAYLAASKKHFPYDGKEMPEKFFTTAQYNSWMQVTYNPTQENVLEYAHGIVDNGFEPGILIIDEGWHKPYGQWEFDPVKFPNPKEMIKELHDLGFTLMLWVCPFVTCSGEKYIMSLRYGAEFEEKKIDTDLYLRTENGDVALMEWWNGHCAILDFTNPTDAEFLKCQLDILVNEYGVDGFKFDGGQLYHYTERDCANGIPSKEHTQYERNIAWNEFGRQYKFHEYKDTFKGGGKCGIQRLMDRMHSWDREGINTILPYSLAQSLIGTTFICPDMIGGGEWSIFLRGITIDEELFVRMCQVSTLFPMMQFSLAPWKFLNKENLNICLDMAKLHKKMSPYIVEKVNESRTSGEPLVRHLEYEFPNQGFENTTDCFMCADKYLVAPVLVKGMFKREVRLPAGNSWKYIDGKVYEGGQTVTVDSPIEVLPYFERL